MALGYMLTEEVLWAAEGDRAPGPGDGTTRRHRADQVQVNLGTWNYKPPSALDIPQVLNVSLLSGETNPSPTAVKGSKASGEPPMALAAAVALAVKSCVSECRRSLHGIDDYLSMDLPLTVERIQRACLADHVAALRLR